MQRYFIPKEYFFANEIVIKGEDAHHIKRVMRSRVGDRLICADGEGRTVLAEITSLDGEQVLATIVSELSEDSEPQLEVWIAQSLPKGDKMDWIVQKCTEIGVAKIIPFVSERTIVQYEQRKEEKRLERWRKIAKEAAEQAHRDRIPQIEPTKNWQQLLLLTKEADTSYIAYEAESESTLRSRLQAEPLIANSRMMLIIGPEGGFSQREVAEASSTGVKPISLGKRILRTETAAIVGLTCILYESGDLGG